MSLEMKRLLSGGKHGKRRTRRQTKQKELFFLLHPLKVFKSHANYFKKNGFKGRSLFLCSAYREDFNGHGFSSRPPREKRKKDGSSLILLPDQMRLEKSRPNWFLAKVEPETELAPYLKNAFFRPFGAFFSFE